MKLWLESGRVNPQRLTLSADSVRILTRIAEGFENGDIAKEFATSNQVIKNAIRHLYDFLGASNRAHAVAICYQRGILQIEPRSLEEVCPRCPLAAADFRRQHKV